jgi:hypothetical protein
MRTCPRCGEEVASGAETCGACGAALPPSWRLRPYLISAASLVAIIIAAALLHSLLQSKVVHSPLEFLPGSTRAVVDLDLRPRGPSVQLLQHTWSASDRKELAVRAYDLAQRMVDWSGLQLDVRKDASQWFGGEVLVASIGAPQARSFTPRSAVLVARVTSLRHARGDLDRSVKELAREGSWQRRTLRSDGRAITVWGKPDGRSEIAYAAVDGCLLVSTSSELVDLCLKTLRTPSEGLSETSSFRASRRGIPNDAFVWCYLSAADLLHASREVAPYVTQGWMGLARRYLALRNAASVPRTTPSDGGAIAAAVTPEKDGLRVRASYLRAGKGQAGPASNEGVELLQLVPREAAAFGFVRDLPDLLGVFYPADRRGGRQRHAPSIYWGPLRLVVQPESLPKSVLVALLPRQGTSRPALAAALMGGGAEQTSAWLLQMMPSAKAAEVARARLLAGDEQGLTQLRNAAGDPASRLRLGISDEVVLQAWARPGALSPSFTRVEELSFILLRNPTGADAQISIKAEPRYLLGGREAASR